MLLRGYSCNWKHYKKQVFYPRLHPLPTELLSKQAKLHVGIWCCASPLASCTSRCVLCCGSDTDQIRGDGWSCVVARGINHIRVDGWSYVVARGVGGWVDLSCGSRHQPDPRWWGRDLVTVTVIKVSTCFFTHVLSCFFTNSTIGSTNELSYTFCTINRLLTHYISHACRE
jgi:hypothetical protein